MTDSKSAAAEIAVRRAAARARYAREELATHDGSHLATMSTLREVESRLAALESHIRCSTK